MSVIVGALLLGFAKYLNSAVFLLFGRVVVGINAALNASLATMYLQVLKD